MMKSIVRILAVASAVVSLGVSAGDTDDVLADFNDANEASSGDVSSDDLGNAHGEGAAVAQAAKAAAKPFYLLPLCQLLEGKAEVRIPGQDAWKRVEEGKYYPLGSIYRTSGNEDRLTIKFGPEASVEIVGAASFSTKQQPYTEAGRSIGLISGVITVKVPSTLKEGLFTVMAPGFTVKNLTGESRYSFAKSSGDGDEAVVRCVTQTLAIEGRHFSAPLLRAANELRIRTSQDQLLTSLYGLSGDIGIVLDQGLVPAVDKKGKPTGEIEEGKLSWKLSPRTSVRIHRAKPSIGDRMVVTTMTFNERGELRNRRAFAEQMLVVNSGELGPAGDKLHQMSSKSADDADLMHEGADIPVGDSDGSSSGDGEEAADSSDDLGF